jgi:hypothetical protein
MTLTNTNISSEDIELFKVSEVESTKKWLEFFNEFDPYNATKEKQNKLRDKLEEVKELVPNSEGDSKHFRDWKVDNIIYACRADLGKISPTTSKYAYVLLIARMVLAFYLANKIKDIDNGQTIDEQIQSLGISTVPIH